MKKTKPEPVTTTELDVPQLAVRAADAIDVAPPPHRIRRRKCQVGSEIYAEYDVLRLEDDRIMFGLSIRVDDGRPPFSVFSTGYKRHVYAEHGDKFFTSETDPEIIAREAVSRMWQLVQYGKVSLSAKSRSLRRRDSTASARRDRRHTARKQALGFANVRIPIPSHRRAELSAIAAAWRQEEAERMVEEENCEIARTYLKNIGVLPKSEKRRNWRKVEPLFESDEMWSDQ